MSKKVCTKKNMDKVRELFHQNGMTCAKIAEILGVSYSSAWRMVNDMVKEDTCSTIKKAYTKWNPMRKDNEAVATIRKMSEAGEPSTKIAKELGVDSSTVLRIMRRLGIKSPYSKYGRKKSNETEASEPLTVCSDGESLEEAMARVEASDKAEKQSEGKETVASLYKKGYAADAIAAKLGISVNGVYAALDTMPKKEEPKFTEKAGVVERMKDALKALTDTDGISDGTSKDIMESRKNYWADVVSKAQETYETARDKINGIEEDMKTDGTEPTDDTANETTMVESDTKDMEDIVVDIMSDAFNGLIRAHGKILMAWADGAYIPETGADMFASLDRLSAAEKEVWNVAVNLKKAVQKDDK